MDIVSLLEPRVNGYKAVAIIKKLGFQHSHRVEVVGFVDGIWMGWKELINVEVDCNHLQFILIRVFSGIHSNYIYIALVYASPNKTKKKNTL